MADFGVTLKRKVGPLPVWAWTGLGVVVLAVILIQRRKKAEAAAAAAQAAQQSNPGATNLGTNSLSNLVPQAYPMPFQMGDVFTNVTTNPVPTPNPTPAPTPKTAHFYVTKKGDTWQSIGKALNIAPVALWQNNGAPPGFKMPAVGSMINLYGISSNPAYAFDQQNTIIANEKQLVQSGFKPTPGQVYYDHPINQATPNLTSTTTSGN